jgi:hypothetical protein
LQEEEGSMSRKESQSSLMNESNYWESEINLQELKLLFRNINEIIQDIHSELSGVILKAIMVIDKLLPNGKTSVIDFSECKFY